MIATALLVGFLFYTGYIGHFFEVTRTVDWWWASAAIPFGCLSLLTQATRWWMLMRKLGRVPLREATLIMLVAGAIGDFVPLRAGAAFQVQIVHRRFGVARLAIAGTLLVEIMLDVVVVAILAILFIPAVSVAPEWRAAISVAFAVVVVLLLAIRFSGPLGHILSSRLPARLSRGVDDLKRALATLTGLEFGGLLGLTFGDWLFSAFGYHVLARAFGLDLSPVAFLTMVLAVNVIAKVSPSEGNIGTYELAAQASLVGFGASGERAAGFAIAAHLSAILGTLVLGVASAWLLRLRRDDVFYV